MRTRFLVAVFLLAAGAAACGGGGSTARIVPRGSSSAGPTSSPGATATGAPNPSATLSAAQVTSALQSTQTYFATLPHADLGADLTSLAAYMVSSKQFTTATVTYGGISATTPDGLPAIVFADHLENFGGIYPASRARTSVTPKSFPAIGGPVQHELAFLVNDDNDPAFAPAQELAFAQAFQNLGFAPPTYGVDVASASIDNIVALGSGHPIDLLHLATHGMVVQGTGITGNYLYYVNDSTTRVDSAHDSAYWFDIKLGNLIHAYVMQYPTTNVISPTYAFTPSFLTKYLRFNPGAIVDFQACFGQNESISASVTSTLQAAGVGRYMGWTKSVIGQDSQQTDAFIFDRLLGEQGAGTPVKSNLDLYAAQRTPPQRPFPLDDIQAIAHTEQRSGPTTSGNNGPYAYDFSDQGNRLNRLAPPLADGTAAKLVVSDFGGENVASPPIEYALPSIAQMAVTTELPGSGTLTIAGRFPAPTGTVQITDSLGAHALPVVSWSTKKIAATLPASGPGSAGLVQVLDVTGIASNAVPLTQWSGTVTYTENDDVTNMGGVSGTGSLAAAVEFDITFRSDVHPTVPSIDATPVPQNLTFPQVEGSSTAAVTQLKGGFLSSQGTPPPAFANLQLSSVSPMTPKNLNSNNGLDPGTFAVGAYAGQPAPCNNASPGPQGNAGNVFCPAFGYVPPSVGICSTDANDPGLCSGAVIFSPAGSFGAPSRLDPAIVSFTMDPVTYMITVNGANGTFTRRFASSFWPATASVTGTINAPLYAPNATTPASVRRRTAAR